MRSKLLGFGIPLTAAVFFGYGMAHAHPQNLWSQVLHRATQQGQQVVHHTVGQLTHAAHQYVSHHIASTSITSTKPAVAQGFAVTLKAPAAPTRVWINDYLDDGDTPHPMAFTVHWTKVPDAQVYYVIATHPGDPKVTAETGTRDAILPNLLANTTYRVVVYAGRSRTQSGQFQWSLPSSPVAATTWSTWTQIEAASAPDIVTTHEVIPTGGMQGTAFALDTPFMVNGQVTWVTAEHVVSNDVRGPDLTVTFHDSGLGSLDGQTVPAAWDGYSPEDGYEGHLLSYDLATLTVDHSPLMGLPLNTHPIYVGEPILILGHPLGRSLTESTGVVTAVGVQDAPVANDNGSPFRSLPYELQGNAWAAGGNSGSPVLNRWGQVIGVDDNGVSNGSHYEGIIPITALRFVQRMAPPPDYPPSFFGGL